MKSETTKSDRRRDSRSTAKSKAARRFPRLAPRAMATVGNSASALDPPDGEDTTAGAGAVGSAPQKIGAPGNRLVEEPFVLERLSQDHTQQAPVPRVGHGLDARAPLPDELLRGIRILANQLRLHIIRLSRRVDRWLAYVFERPSHVGDRIAQPVELHVLTCDHV